MRIRLGGLAFLLAAVIYLGGEAITAAAWRTPVYDYAVNYISDLSVPGCGVVYSGRELCSPLAGLMSAGFVVDGVLFLLAGVLLSPLLTPRLRVAFVAAAALYGVGNVAVGLFDETTGAFAAGLPSTHVMGATLAIGFGNVAAIVGGSWGIRAGHRRCSGLGSVLGSVLGWVVVALGVVGLICFVAVAFSPFTIGPFGVDSAAFGSAGFEAAGVGSFVLPEGAVERVAVYPITVFEVLAGVVALRIAGRKAPA